MKEKYKQLIEARNKADTYFRDKYFDDTPKNQENAKLKISAIMQEMAAIEKQIYPWMQQYHTEMADNRQSMYVEFPPETFENLTERIDIIGETGWRLKEMVQKEGKEYGYFERGS